jgi:hypothetical protein
MPTTSDPNDPRLTRGPDTEPTEQAPVYLVMADEEREAGFVRPLRDHYTHVVCGSVTRMSRDIAESYARRPDFYGATYCCVCRRHLPVGPDGEFEWDDGSRVGT